MLLILAMDNIDAYAGEWMLMHIRNSQLIVVSSYFLFSGCPFSCSSFQSTAILRYGQLLLAVEARTVNDAPAKHGDVPQGTNFPITLLISYTSVSENSVPLNPMVNDHYPY